MMELIDEAFLVGNAGSEEKDGRDLLAGGCFGA